MNPAMTLVLILIIGIAVGIVGQRLARPSWISRQLAGGHRADFTSALVGVAGAFIGFHAAALLIAGTGALLVAAAVGAALVLWGWREIRL